MRKSLGWTAILGMVVFYVVACAPVNFGVNNSPVAGFTQFCATSSGGSVCDYTEDVTGPKVDILFVNDNSASMSFEQKALANRFAGFIQMLDGKHIDYRIAMTTTDVHSGQDGNEPRAINGNGSLQNGNLISYGDGINYLTPAVGDRVSRFNAAVVRPETLKCEQFIADWVSLHGTGTLSSDAYKTQYKANCPSGDERGTFAANLAVKNNSGSFLRDDAYLAIIFVADEDVRSGLYCGGPNNPNPNCQATGYPLEDMDQPLSLFNTFKARGKDKTTEIHAIVVTDNTCLTQQNSQSLGSPAVAATNGLVSGSLGNLYMNFPQNGWGVSVSICNSNYTTYLNPIANKIAQNKGAVIGCENPIDLQVTPIPANPSFSYTRTGKSIVYNTQLPAGSQVRFTYSCPNQF